MEIRWYPTGAVHEHGQRFDWREFVSRVSDIEGSDPPEAAYHAQVIVDLVSTLVPPSDPQQLRDQLPESEDDENWRKLFAVIDTGSGVTPKKHRRAAVRNPTRVLPTRPGRRIANRQRIRSRLTWERSENVSC